MNKAALIRKIIQSLAEDLEIYCRAAQASHAEATHEQNKAESKYDTRGLEASYLARGQSRQAAQMEEAIRAYDRLRATPRSFGAGDAIDTGALVELESRDERLFYLVGPVAGGTEATVGGKEVTVITPESPLGKQLIGKRQGDKLVLKLGGAGVEYGIIRVQ